MMIGKNRDNPGQHAGLMKRATYFSVGVAFIIVTIKLFSWWQTGSVAVLASLVDSGLDVISAVLNMIALQYALQPPDREHRFGHGKAEDIASLGQAAFIFGSGLFVLAEVVRRFFHPHPVENELSGIAVMAFCTFITTLLIIFQRSVVRKTASNLINTDAYHYFTDIMTNLAVIFSLLITKFLKFQGADPAFGICVGLYIMWGAVKIASKPLKHLMDEEMDDNQRKKIQEMVLSHPGIAGMHDLRTRISGINSFIQFHLEIDGDMKLEEAHRISEELEKKIEAEFPHSEVLIHQDPVRVGRLEEVGKKKAYI